MDWTQLNDAAGIAHDKAYAPYSKFQVGAAILDEKGRIHIGCNMENASYGLSMCAERDAIAAAISQGAKKIMAVSIVADGKKPCPPCGACRQVIAEFGDASLVVKSRTVDGKEEAWTLGELLPHAFGPGFL